MFRGYFSMKKAQKADFEITIRIKRNIMKLLYLVMITPLFTISGIALGQSIRERRIAWEQGIREKQTETVNNTQQLIDAVLRDDWQEVRNLVSTYAPQYRIELNSDIADYPTYPYGFSPLSIAAYNGDLETVMMLVEHGALVNKSGPYKANALVSAARKPGNIEVVQYIGDRGGYNKLHGAVAATVAADDEIKDYLERKRIEFMMAE